MRFDTLINERLSRLSKSKTIPDIAKLHNTTSTKIKSEHKRGVNVEKEHGGNVRTAKAVAMDHLVENPKYYTKLKKAKL